MSTQATTHTYTIKEVSNVTGLPASTLRYYENIGIIQPISRGLSSKQRVYSEDDLGVLDAIACLSATGMSIGDMRTYLANRHRGAEGAAEQIALLARQKKHLAQEMKILKVRQEYVQLKLDYWQAVASDDNELARRIGSQARELAAVLKFSKEL